MGLILTESSERSRSVLFGLLLSCLFSEEAKNKCPLSRLRNNLTIEEKYDYIWELSENEVKNTLEKHGKCFEKRIFSTMQLELQESPSDTP